MPDFFLRDARFKDQSKLHFLVLQFVKDFLYSDRWMFTFSYLLTNLFFHYIMNCCSSELEWYKHNTQLVHIALIKINEKILTISLIQNSRWGPTYPYLKDPCEDRVTYLSIHWLTGKGKKGSLASVLAALYSCSMPTPPLLKPVQSLKIKYIPKAAEKGERESQSEWAWLANLKKKKSPAPYNQKEYGTVQSQSGPFLNTDTDSKETHTQSLWGELSPVKKAYFYSIQGAI